MALLFIYFTGTEGAFGDLHALPTDNHGQAITKYSKTPIKLAQHGIRNALAITIFVFGQYIVPQAHA